MPKNSFICVLTVIWCVSAAFPFAGAQQQSWVGYITDIHCGTNCQVTKNMTPDLKCIRRCVKKGSKYGLWSGNKVHVLEPQTEARRFVAKNVKVTALCRATRFALLQSKPRKRRPSRNPKRIEDFEIKLALAPKMDKAPRPILKGVHAAGLYLTLLDVFQTDTDLSRALQSFC
jgi:hypothetical protein